MQLQLFIKGSNSLDLLADKIAEDIQRRKPGVFQPVYIVTQTEGMQSWLKMQLAQKNGIAANIVFLKPNELINKIYKASGGKYEVTLSPSDIQWLVYKILNEDRMHTEYPELTAYFKSVGGNDNMKRIALSREIADMFDQYQIYRTDMLKGWENGILMNIGREEKWQADLWVQVRKMAGDAFPDRNKVSRVITENLADENHRVSLRSQFPVVYFFGTSLITSFHHDILLTVSQYIPIVFYLPNPSPHLYWYEDKTQKQLFYQRKKGIHTDENILTNPLLLNWGKLIQQTFQLFFKNDEVINAYEDITAEIEPATLLASVQHFIHKNSVAENELLDDEILKDGSITIRSCFSMAREVETLYNYLVALIDAHPGKYSSRDIVVHVTDINKYASYIRAVFDHAPYPMRYTIADESFTESDTISHALFKILTMEERDFTSENVVQLLNFSSIRRHFRITDVNLIRDTVRNANIRHGIEGRTEDDSIYVSWKYGLQRIMYGICIKSDDQYGDGPLGFYPLDEVESGDAGEVIHFVYLVEKLIFFLKQREGEKTLAEWAEYIYNVIHHLIFDEEEADNEEYRQLIERVKDSVVDESLFKEKVSWQVFLCQFLPGLNELTQTYKFARGGVTFCSLIPMRSIPFRIVAMLGLDFDKFPRKSVQSGFDLMAKAPRAGDRNIKTNDKHLFLETLLSAGDYLYLSYIGQQITNNSKKPASILVDELLAFIESSSAHPEKVKQLLFRNEPLHSFSSKYGNESGYDNYLLTTQNAIPIENEAPEEEPLKPVIDLNALYHFLCNPVEWYYKKNFGIYYDNEVVTLPEVEKFDLNHLEKWSVKNALLLLDDDRLEDFIDQGKKSGNLPLRNSAVFEVENVLEEIYPVKLLFDEERNEAEPSVGNIEMEIGDNVLTASIPFVFDDKVLIPCFSKSKQKYLLKAWLTSLFLSAAGRPVKTIYIDDKKVVFPTIKSDDARKRLKRLIRLMEEGTKTVLVFNIGWVIFDKILSEEELDKEIEKKAGKDAYLDLAFSDGFLASPMEGFEKVFNEIAAPINAIIN